ncbi:DUF4153 domain-containing protein [Albibacterium profundi]|uniref:DUF4153 domain-containing protein n=1 Tax=Albibacterium profundi TaxID=3134906 RepID=A0ABV5CHC3_9SPHI
MLKLPSIHTLWTSLRNILFRFPLQSLITLFAMSLWLSAADNYVSDHVDMIYKLVVLSMVAFTTSLSIALLAESRNISMPVSLGIQFLFIALSYSAALIIYPEYFKTDTLKIILLILAGHLMVSCSPYINTSNQLAFWNFNKTLFLRFFTSILFSALLYIGLAVALFSIESLFQLDFKGDVYFKLFIIIGVGFNTLFFLDGIPSNLTKIAEISEYPKALKIFTQYVLVPLSTIYLAILLVYELKITFNMQLPDGMVSILIMGYAVFGILSYLLIYPISTKQRQGWINQFSTLFFWFMLPLLILLFVAIIVRIQDYGVTEMRYFVFVLAIWLTCITIYFITKRNPNIQVIPISLFIATILSITGPQSASSISKKSQQSRLSKNIETEDPNEEKISIVNYLVRYHGLTSLESFIKQNTHSVQTQILNAQDSLRSSNFQKQSLLLDTAFSMLAIDRYPSERAMISFVNRENYIRDTNFDIIFWMPNSSNTDDKHTPMGTINTSYVDNRDFYVVFDDRDSVRFSIEQFGEFLISKYDSLKTADAETSNQHIMQKPIDVPSDWMTLNAENAKYRVQLLIQTITIDNKNDTEQPTFLPYFSGYILIDEK